MSRFAVARVEKLVNRILQQGSLRTSHGVKRQLYARYPEIDAELMEFLQFARSQRLPISRTILQQRARIAAERLNVSEFKASNGYIDRFLRRNPVQKSIGLHGKGSSYFPMDHTIRMEEIRSTVGNYPMKMVYNMDETGLFYRLGPNRTYLLASEDRRTTRGTELQKHKSRVTAVLCVNADGSHTVPPRYIGKSVNPKCFNDFRFSHHRNFYSSQAKGWIDSDGFDKWIKWWHDRTEKHNPGPKLLIMDN